MPVRTWRDGEARHMGRICLSVHGPDAGITWARYATLCDGWAALRIARQCLRDNYCVGWIVKLYVSGKCVGRTGKAGV